MLKSICVVLIKQWLLMVLLQMCLPLSYKDIPITGLLVQHPLFLQEFQVYNIFIWIFNNLLRRIIWITDPPAFPAAFNCILNANTPFIVGSYNDISKINAALGAVYAGYGQVSIWYLHMLFDTINFFQFIVDIQNYTTNTT